MMFFEDITAKSGRLVARIFDTDYTCAVGQAVEQREKQLDRANTVVGRLADLAAAIEDGKINLAQQVIVTVNPEEFVKVLSHDAARHVSGDHEVDVFDIRVRLDQKAPR
jgi:hypothetical protein